MLLSHPLDQCTPLWTTPQTNRRQETLFLACMMSQQQMSWVQGGCHCGRIRFSVLIPETIEVEDCNCSICSKSGFLHLIVPKSRFILLSGKEEIQSYRFGTHVAQHLFCRHCGIKSYYIPRSNPNGIDINARFGSCARQYDCHAI